MEGKLSRVHSSIPARLLGLFSVDRIRECEMQFPLRRKYSKRKFMEAGNGRVLSVMWSYDGTLQLSCQDLP